MGEDASTMLYGVRVLLLDFLFIIDWLINLVYPHVGLFFFFGTVQFGVLSSV